MLLPKSLQDESMPALKSIFGVVESFSTSFSVDDYPLTMNLSRNYSKRSEVSFSLEIGGNSRRDLFEAESFIGRCKTINCQNVGYEFRRTSNDSSNL